MVAGFRSLLYLYTLRCPHSSAHNLLAGRMPYSHSALQRACCPGAHVCGNHFPLQLYLQLPKVGKLATALKVINNDFFGFKLHLEDKLWWIICAAMQHVVHCSYVLWLTAALFCQTVLQDSWGLGGVNQCTLGLRRAGGCWPPSRGIPHRRQAVKAGLGVQQTAECTT